jgi:RHS repeat-associated protein
MTDTGTSSFGGVGMGYDLSNQPVITWDSAVGNYYYDGNFKRVKQVLNNGTIYSVYGLSGALLHRYNETTGERTDYIDLGGAGSVRVKNGTPTWVALDHLGSSTARLDSSGNRIWRREYTPYGEEWSYTGSAGANDNEPGFTGQVEDEASGLTYMQARYYDPVLGRFLSADPVEFAPARPDMHNRYAYAANDPVNKIDPDGEAAVRVGVFVARHTAGRALSGMNRSFAGARPRIIEVPATVPTSTAAGPLVDEVFDQIFNDQHDNSDVNAEDRQRQTEQRDRRADRRQRQSRGEGGNGQNQTGHNPERAEGRENANKGPSGQRPKGPDRSHNRERNIGVDEEHSMKPKGSGTGPR